LSAPLRDVKLNVQHLGDADMSSKALFCALACISVAGSLTPSTSHAQTPAPFMTGAQIQKDIVGKTFSSTTKRGIKYTMQLDNNGTGTFVYSGSKKDPLTWDLKGDVLCFHSAMMANTECNKVRSASGKFDFVDSSTGGVNNTYTPQ
jgi:hypothetical protein